MIEKEKQHENQDERKKRHPEKHHQSGATHRPEPTKAVDDTKREEVANNKDYAKRVEEKTKKQ